MCKEGLVRRKEDGGEWGRKKRRVVVERNMLGGEKGGGGGEGEVHPQLEEELVRQRVARKWYLVVIG